MAGHSPGHFFFYGARARRIRRCWTREQEIRHSDHSRAVWPALVSAAGHVRTEQAMIENLRAPLMARTILLGATALSAVHGAAAARGASQEHKEHKVPKNHAEKDRARAPRKQHAK